MALGFIRRVFSFGQEAETPAPSEGESHTSEPGEGKLTPSPASGKITVTKTVEQSAEPPPPAPEAPRQSWFQRLSHGLARSSRELTGNIAGVFTKKRLDEETLQDL